MKATSIKGNSTVEIKVALQLAIKEDFKPTLAIVFISVKQDRNAVCELLNKHHIDCIGATSCTEFTESNQSDGGIAIMLLELDRNHYCILFEDIGERTLAEAATHLTQTALQKFNKPSFIICSTSLTETGLMLDGETLIRSIEKTVGSQVNMFGGMAGDDLTFTGTYIFTNEQTSNFGIAALVLNEAKIAMHGVALSGWKPIGVSRTITKSKKNLLYEIDGKPALEAYLKFLGEDFASTDDRVKIFR